MILNIKSELPWPLCLFLLCILNATCGGSNFLWPWNIFPSKMDHYDKDVESRANLTTNEWIQNMNLICDVHEVTTEDGYILTLHRIPKPGYQPVLLVHGLFTSSLSFVMLGKDNSLAFQFASNGYDVWLANTRGTTYSRKHTTYSPNDPNFWKFSFHEIGLYDISATIDYVRNATAFHQIIYKGHSEGASVLFVLCSMRPEYNDRILLMQALAPIVYLRNMTTITKTTVNIIKKFIKEKSKAKSLEVFPQGELLRRCSIKSKKRPDCLELMRDILGPGQYNQTNDPIVLGRAIAGSSIHDIEHFYQILSSGDFVAFDYGLEGNQALYKHPEPDEYDLEMIKFPIILHFGHTDAIATPAAVHKLYKILPNVVGLYEVPAEEFNHFDFIWSPSVGSLLNRNVLKVNDEFLNGTLKYRID